MKPGQVLFTDVKKAFPHVEELIPGDLWVFHDLADNTTWLTSEFYSFCEGPVNDSEDGRVVQRVLHTEGSAAESMRECRHSTWGDGDGYIFYMNFNQVRAILKWLEKYYDGN